ncbi:MAG: hypothetical protein ACXVLQ_18515 [Bacteriovorax sp.]
MKLKKPLMSAVLVGALLGFTGCKKDPTGVLITGLDEEGKVIDAVVPSKSYSLHMEKMMKSVVDESFRALDLVEVKESRSSWRPSKIVVGLSLSGSVGVGKILSAEAEPGIEFIFKKTSPETNE